MNKKEVPRKGGTLTVSKQDLISVRNRLREYSKSNVVYLSHWRALKGGQNAS